MKKIKSDRIKNITFKGVDDIDYFMNVYNNLLCTIRTLQRVRLIAN